MFLCDDTRGSHNAPANDVLRQNAAYAHGPRPDCGYCIAESYDSGCVPGDATGPWSPIVAGGSTLSDCSREWQAGTFRPPGSMCVTVVSSTDLGSRIWSKSYDNIMTIQNNCFRPRDLVSFPLY